MKIIPGTSEPLGFSKQGNVFNFALFSSQATKVTLGFFEGENPHPIKEIPLNRSDSVWHVAVIDLPEGLSYAYRCEGKEKEFFKEDLWLLDPYAKIVEKGRAKAELTKAFDWGKDTPPHISLTDLVIYEMHVRGFTKDSSSLVAHPGTYLGMIEKIPHLKKLGINAVELMPIFGFDPHLMKFHRTNYWGYQPLAFFAPMDWYAVKDAPSEFKALVKALHQEGIEVLLDVVYNHTGEEGKEGYWVHFKGIDPFVYYMIDENNHFLDYTGCKNTLNVNHPVVRRLILDSLRYWVQEMHVDGFRFDLAAIFNRGVKGEPIENPPILEEIRKDPILKQVKLIAEPWDAAGQNLLGFFPKKGPWMEWNGYYRDTLRKFIKGEEGQKTFFADAFCASPSIYETPLKSINFITSHDGFTLRDLVSYEKKRNEENQEQNFDGSNDNLSWNCGWEGPTDQIEINAIRERQMRNFFLALFLSQGIPMLTMGDEYGHTRNGNNNPYVQDNECNWFLWNQLCPQRLSFLSSLIEFRNRHPLFKKSQFLKNEEIFWFDTPLPSLICFQTKSLFPLFIAFNASSQPHPLPSLEKDWKVIVDTFEDWIVHKENFPLLKNSIAPHSAFLAFLDRT